MRLMYIRHPEKQIDQETTLHRHAPAVPGRFSWHSSDHVFSCWEARPAALTSVLACVPLGCKFQHAPDAC